MVGDEIALVLVIEENNQQIFLFEADINVGYEIDLPYGIYSIYVFLMDPEGPNLFDAAIYAIVFHCAEHIDLSRIGSFSLAEYDNVWDLVDEIPIKITIGGPFYLDFILIDSDVEPDLPKSFSELLKEGGQEIGYICPNCGTQATSIIDACGATINDVRCNACGNWSPISDICPHCKKDIESIICYKCGRMISALTCPGCGKMIPI